MMTRVVAATSLASLDDLLVLLADTRFLQQISLGAPACLLCSYEQKADKRKPDDDATLLA